MALTKIPASLLDTTSGLTVAGDLTVNGTTTTLDSTTLQVADKNIVLNYHASNDTSSAADGAGITIQDAVNGSTDATILWDATNDKFTFSHPIHPTNILINDNNKIRLGNSQDLEIFHDGTHSLIDDVGTGSLILRSDTSVILRKRTGDENMLVATPDGAVELYHNNVKKLETTATGVQTVGTVNVNGAYTLPTSDGSANQVLQTDGSGTLSFATVSAGGGGTVSEAFKNIAVSGQTNIVADSATDTLTFAAGSNITLTTNASTDTVTIAASGGEVTVQEEGSSLSTAATTLNFVGAGVTASGSGATKTITIPGGGGEVFKTIAVSGQTDVVADSSTDTLTLAAGSGMTITTNASSDTVTFASTGGNASASDIRKRFVYTTSSSTTAFSGSDDNSQTLSYTIGAVDVFLNGVLQKLTTDYAETNSSTITFVNAVPSGSVVEIIAFYRTIGTGNSVVDQFTGDGSTTAFTVTTAPADEKNLMVYIDGVYQQKTDYTVSGTTLTFDTAPASGATIETVAMVGAITTQGALTLTGALTGTSADFSGDVSVEGNLLLDGDNKELRFYEGSNFVGFEAPALSGDQIWVLPDSDGSSGHALKTDGSGNLSWGTAGGNAFDKVAVSGQSNIVADQANDTLTLTAGSGITLTNDASNDAVTIAATASAITVQDEGSALSTAATTLNFVGAGVTASGTGATKTITIGGGGSGGGWVIGASNLRSATNLSTLSEPMPWPPASSMGASKS